MTNLIEVATSGREDGDDPTDGYLYSVYENLGGDHEILQDACDEMNFPGELRAALLIAQKVRFVPGEESAYGAAPTRPKDVLRPWSDVIRNSLAEVETEEPRTENVKTALEAYNVFSNEEAREFLEEL